MRERVCPFCYHTVSTPGSDAEYFRDKLQASEATARALQAKLEAMTQVNAELSAKLVRIEANRAAWVKQMAEAHTQAALAYVCGAIAQK